MHECMKFTLGTKEGMTQVYDDQGVVHPATILNTGNLVVTQVKTQETDGYHAVQVGFGEQKESRINKAQRSKGNHRVLREIRLTEAPSVAVGDTISVADAFAVGDKVAVSGTSKGKGFQGVVKRYNFAGGPRSHGQKHTERAPGSIGAKGPARVFKGRKMPGHMGASRVTVKNLVVLAVDSENNQLIVEGAVPGRRGTLIEVRGA